MLFDGTKLDKVYVIVDETTANTIDEIHKEVITKWDWESEENEKRRTIKILDRMYLPQVLKEVTNVLRAY
jgi:asparagine synthetase A